MGMVVRSNIMAVNAQRQLGMNNSQVGKSLEKLSSGFRINRAGDDASGLAISEKMKAQIRGLETASSNSQDGISLIQTAEGALTEVHDMLNRMVEIAGKAANGTMDDDTDRAALQKEVDALKSEINRIAEGTNFNGINLLDGSMGSAAKISTQAGKDGTTTITPDAGSIATDITTDATLNAGDLNMTIKDVAANKGAGTSGTWGGGTNKFEVQTGGNTEALNGKKITIKIDKNAGKDEATIDGDGNVTVTLKTEYTASQGNNAKNAIETALQALAGTGDVVDAWKAATVTVTLDTNLADAQNANATVTGGVATNGKEVTVTDGTNTFTYKGATIDTAGGTTVLTSADGKTVSLKINNDTAATNKKVGTIAVDAATSAKTTIDFKGKTGKDVFGATVTVGDKTYEFVKTGGTAKTKGATAIEVGEADTAETIANELEAQIAADLVAAGGTHNANVNGAAVEIENATPGAAGENVKVDQQGAGLELQIGDTADSFNKLGVVIKDMSTKGLEIEDLSVLKKDDASKALDAIKKGADSAINRVSAARADLGAAQNRLEHTINNLDVATENMTSANSRIRDTDMAKQMMDYTKMNVLTQAAQAMLAQANQQPQSVLQLLQ